MKRFQRVGAFLMTLALLVGLLPTGVFSIIALDAQAQEDTAYVHASYTASAYVADGDVDLTSQPAYRRTISLSNGQNFSVVWDKTNVYVAASADITELKINGVDKTPAGEVKNEVLIPLSELGIVDLTQAYTFCVKVGDLVDAWSGKLVFDADIYATKSYTPGTSNSYKETVFSTYGEYYFNNGWSVELDSYYWNGQPEAAVASKDVKDGEYKENHRDIYYPHSVAGLYVDFSATTVAEFDLKIEQLPEIQTVKFSTGRSFLNNAVCVTLGDDDDIATHGSVVRKEAMQYGVYHHNGKLMFAYWDSTTFKTVELCDYEAAENQTFHIRAEFNYKPTAAVTEENKDQQNDIVAADYYVNGKFVGHAENAKRKNDAGYVTKQCGSFTVLTQTSRDSYGGSDESRIDVVLSNVSATKKQAGLEVLKRITAIGTVTAENMEKVSAARLAYNALTEEHKALVTNLAVLEAAEAAVKNIPYFHASFADTAITVDGTMNLAKEPAYRRTIVIGGNKVSAVWDGQGNLYLAAEAAITELKINGKAVSADAAEVKVSMASVGIADLSAKYTLSFKVGETAVSGVLVLDGIVFSKTNPSKTIANGAECTDGWTAVLNTYDTTDTTQDLYYPGLAGLGSSLTAPTVLEMDLTINQLPEHTTNLAWGSWAGRTYIKGLNIVVMDEDNKINETYNNAEVVSAKRVLGAEAMVTGILRKDGKLYLAYPYNKGTSGDVELVEIDTYEEGKEYHLRIEYSYAPNTGDEEQGWKNTRRDNVFIKTDKTHGDIYFTDQVQDNNNDNNNNVSVKYYINGKLVSVKEDVKKYYEKGWVSSGNNIIQINALGNASEEGSTKITVANLSATHAQPGLEVVKKIAALDAMQSPDKQTVEAVRAAYDALTDEQKVLVTNLSVLEAIEVFWSKVVYIHAGAASGITLDGALENAYRMNVNLSSTLKVGAAWDLNYLYLGFRDSSAKVSEMTGLTVNGVSITGVAVEKKEITSGDGRVVEYRIPWTELGITVDTAYDMAFSLGDLQWSGKLVLGTDDYATAMLTGSYGAKPIASTNNRAINLISTDGVNAGNATKYQLASTSSYVYKLEGLPETATIFEFDVKINEMSDASKISGTTTSAGRTFCQGGLGVSIRDQDPSTVDDSTMRKEAFFVGLCKQNGTMMLVYYDTAAGGFVTTAAGESADGEYHIRVEYLYPEDVFSNDIVANYYVNGRLIATAQSAKQSGGSKSSGGMGVNFVAFNGTNGETTDVLISNVSVSHAKGLDAVEKQLDTTEPDQTNIVLQLGADKSQMNFTWFSKSEAAGKIAFAKTLDNGALPANAIVVDANRTGSSKEGYYGNKVAITGLEPGTTYYYQLINGEDKTELKSFKTGADGNFSFAFAGDPQIGRGYGSDDGNNDLVLGHLKEDYEHWDRTLNQLVTAPEFAGINFLMAAGDQTNTHMGNYADHETQFDAYANHDVLLGMPTVTVLGNHDADTYPIYNNHFNLPNMLINPETGTYYGATYAGTGANAVFQSADYYFTYNNVLFLVLNTNTYYHSNADSNEHLAFIDRVMAETAGQDFDWTITLYHQSPYGSSYHQDADREEKNAYIEMRSVLIPKLYEAGVDMILSGHDHCYTRTYVLKPGTENGEYNDSYVIQNPDATAAFGNADGIVHVTAATASASQVNEDKYNTEAYKVITATANTRHMSRIEVTENTLTLITYNLGTQLSNHVTEVDRFTLTNNADSAVEAAIGAIGTVTVDSENEITAARAAYEALSPQLKKRVSNLEVLVAAEDALAQAKQEAADKETADKAAAEAVDALINAIGSPVTLDSIQAIVAAEEAYNNLTEDQKDLVENYLILTDARAAYDTLKAAADKEAADKEVADKAAADAAIAKIEAIGTVTLESKLAIEAARVAYNALTAEQKALVSAEVLLKLTNAETALKALETPEEPPKTGDATMIVPVMLLIGLSVAGLAVVLTGKKRFF